MTTLTESAPELPVWRRIRAHADDPIAGACLLCRRIECAVFRRARAELAMAGELDYDRDPQRREVRS